MSEGNDGWHGFKANPLQFSASGKAAFQIPYRVRFAVSDSVFRILERELVLGRPPRIACLILAIKVDNQIQVAESIIHDAHGL